MTLCRSLAEVEAAARRDATADPPPTQAQADQLAAIRALAREPAPA